MYGKVSMIAGAALLLSVGVACADDFDVCVAECRRVQQECIDGITLFDAAGIAEAKAACNSQYAPCNQKCHDIDAAGAGYEEMQKKQAEEAERKRQEEQQAASGGIKSYDNDNGIKTYVFQ